MMVAKKPKTNNEVVQRPKRLIKARRKLDFVYDDKKTTRPEKNNINNAQIVPFGKKKNSKKVEVAKR